ncbi:HMG box protein-like protein [Massarina eburnea CBS 473.64]|uniref:HMG box protein-like protein n=1 Tax=Massarina eburnea CBS 473.64 TaxID=1395130 RepID=A0A6A6RX78_9PLEO|nr:HMG box protein-like protein [Massarina eburnea CBS 473.64]
MKSETLLHQHPPTPPNVHADLQNSLDQLVQYNAERSFPYDESHAYGAGYGSPGPTLHDGFSQHSAHVGSQAGESFGLGIQYDGYSQSPAYYQEGQHNGLSASTCLSNKEARANITKGSQAMFSGSPPTPRSTTENDDGGRQTRSNRTLAPSSSPREEERPKAKPASKAKKAKAAKGDKPKMPKLTAPLSILTKELVNIPVRNMEEWVNRSVEVRRKEVEKRNGYVTRPMNSFMLYRSAYAERTKQWCLQNNHQIVSSVSGESWPLEPPAIRELYNEYAKLERINHQNAHPTYKFSPSKTAAPARKRKGEFSEEEPSDLDDAEWNPGQGRSRPRQSRRADRSMGYPANGMNSEYFDRSFGPNGNGINKSSWDMSNEGRPMPMSMGHEDMYNQYFQTSMHPGMSMNAGVMDDLRLRRVDTPISSMQFSPDHALLGLPGGNAVDLMQQLHSHSSTPLGGESQVDPMLLAFDDGHHNVGAVPVQHPEFRNGHMSMIDRELDHHGVDGLINGGSGQEEYRPDPWQPDPSMGTMEQESEFDKWGLIGDH